MSGTLRSALGNTKGKIGEIGDSIRRLGREQRLLGDSIQTFGRMGKNVDGLRAKYARVTDELEKQRRAQQRLLNIEQKRKRLADQRSELRGQIVGTAAAGVAAALPIGAAFKRSADFQYELQLIGNTADMSGAEVAKLGATIMAASRDTGQSAENMQKAIGFLVAAGLDARVAADSVQQIGRTATASGAEIEDLSKAAFTLMDSLKIAPGQALQDALDTLAQAGKEGNVELRDMAKALPVLGSGFLALKMEGREAAATMGAALEIARKGAADADEAANNMRNFIAKVMSPETLKKAKKTFNLDLYKVITQAQTKGKNPFEEAVVAIMKATKGDQKKIGEMFQDMQVQNFIRPMIQNWEEYRRIKDVSLNAKGVTDRDFDKMMATARKQMDGIGNAVGRLAVAIGATLMPAFGNLAAAITPVIDGLTDFINAHPQLVGNTMLVIGSLGALRIGMLAARYGILLARGAFVALNAVMAANPIGLAIRAIAIAAPLIVTYWKPIKAFFLEWWGVITDLFAKGKVAVVDWWDKADVLGKAKAAFEPVRTFFVGLVDEIVAKWNTALEWITKKIEWVGQQWKSTKEFFGFGGETPADAAPAPPGPVAPPPPQIAGRSGASGTWEDNSQNNFNIYQQPGESMEQLARRIAAEQERQRQARARGSLLDGAYAQ